MTSCLRTLQNKPSEDYVRITGPYYIDSVLGASIIPFLYENGTLDIAHIDNFNAYSGYPLMNADIGLYNTPFYKLVGGCGLVQKLGNNFLRYICDWRTKSTKEPVHDVKLHSNCIMTKIQRSPKTTLFSGSTVRINTSPPSSDLYLEGDDSVNYRTVWIFKTPLTIRTVEDGITKYITFASTFY
jgi:hypothetical protein